MRYTIVPEGAERIMSPMKFHNARASLHATYLFGCSQEAPYASEGGSAPHCSIIVQCAYGVTADFVRCPINRIIGISSSADNYAEPRGTTLKTNEARPAPRGVLAENMHTGRTAKSKTAQYRKVRSLNNTSRTKPSAIFR